MAGDCSVTFSNLSPEELSQLAAYRAQMMSDEPASDIRSATHARTNAKPDEPVVGNGEKTADEMFGPRKSATVRDAAPSTGSTTATASPVDSRGVVWHPDHHGPLDGTTGGKNANGAWKKKRNSDDAAHAAYEAQFLGKSHAPAVAGSNASAPETGNGAGASGTRGSTPGSSLPVVPTFVEFLELWEGCVAADKVNDHLMTRVIELGGDPSSPEGSLYETNGSLRRMIGAELRKL